MGKNILSSVLFVVVYTLFWGAWALVDIYFGGRIILNCTWIGVFFLAVFGLIFAWVMDTAGTLIDLSLLRICIPNTKPLYFAWIPTLTLGLRVVLFPLLFIRTIDERITSSGWAAALLLVIFPLMNFVSVVRTPWHVNKAV